MARPSADGVDASHAGPARGDDTSEHGPSAGNQVPHGGVDPSAASSSIAVSAAAADQPHVNLLREQDHFMPVANVIRIMRRVLPMHAKISDGAKETMQECLSEYICFIAGGVDATQAGPAGGANASEAGASAGNRVPLGADAPAAFPQSHVNLREQDLLMPVDNVIRIMRSVLPMNAKVSDDARGMIQECVSEHINLITAEANERCKLEKRKTITAENVIWAMVRLGFDSYVGPLRLCLQRCREMESHQRIGLRGEHFPAITNRSHLPIEDTNRTPPLIAQPLLMLSPQPPPPRPPPPPSILVLQPTVPPPRVDDPLDEAPGADYFLDRDVWGWGWFRDKQFRGSTNA